MKSISAVLATCAILAACSKPVPVDTTLIAIPAPPTGTAQLFPKTTGVAIQSRPGDCARAACQTFVDGTWQPLEATQVTGMALLSVDEATGGHYSEDLWRPVTPTRAILLNATAGNRNIASGLFDGLRIGLRDGVKTTYLTAYAIENGGTLQGAGHCLSGVGCALPLGAGLYLSPVDASLVISNGHAWLLQHRPDRSANLVDLYAAAARPDTVLCLPGLALSTHSAWAGPVEAALSPDMFVSQKVDPAARDAERAAVLAKCPAKAKG